MVHEGSEAIEGGLALDATGGWDLDGSAPERRGRREGLVACLRDRFALSKLLQWRPHSETGKKLAAHSRK